jgi:2-haloacid dehalogenase
MSKRPLIVFDVNETLLDLETMNPVFERIFKDPSAMRLWFADLILYSEALTLADAYVPFTDIGAAVLRMFARTRSISLTKADEEELRDRFSSMPAHPEVHGAFDRLKGAGFRLFTLTDNLLEVQGHQLAGAGLIHYFEQRFSVDQEVKRHKPAPEAYRYVQKQLGVPPSQLFLVASHSWDTLGAVAAGWGAALIKRPGNAVLDVGPQATMVGIDLDDIATQLIERFNGK